MNDMLALLGCWQLDVETVRGRVYSLETGEVEYMPVEGNTTAETSVDFLQQLRQRHAKPLIAICDNETCRWNIAHQTRVKVVHTVQVLAAAYGVSGVIPVKTGIQDTGHPLPAFARTGFVGVTMAFRRTVTGRQAVKDEQESTLCLMEEVLK